MDPSAIPILKAAIFRPEATSTAPGAYCLGFLHHVYLQTRHVAEGENTHYQHRCQRSIVDAGGQLEDQQQHNQRGEDKLQRGDGAMLIGQFAPHTLPIATETP